MRAREGLIPPVSVNGLAGVPRLPASTRADARSNDISSRPSASVSNGSEAEAGRASAFYSNPILFLDFPDPDGVRVGDEYFLVCSTFSHEPGLLLLRSRDMIHWRHAGYALPRLHRREFFARPRRGCGVWAPSLRHHDGRFWIYYPDPDAGIYMTQAERFEGPWSEPLLVKSGQGLIDPCPLWDDDGRAWLAHAWAKSRAGFSNVLSLAEMAPDGTRVLEESVVIIDGGALENYHTLEGPKLYKRDGWYHVFAPAGGVAEGWQSVFRSRDIRGPYEARIVMSQGTTPINGPHQGAWLDTPDGRDWFFHFQDRGPFGRILHLQPMRWNDDGWPVIGNAAEGATCGEPALRCARPVDAAEPVPEPGFPASDDFSGGRPGPQWQWEGACGDGWFSPAPGPGGLRLHPQPAENLWEAPNLLTQRVIGPRSSITTKLSLETESEGAQCGLVIMGRDYASIGLARAAGGVRLTRVTCPGADGDGAIVEEEIAGPIAPDGRALLRVTIAEGEAWPFSYSLDEGATWRELGAALVPRPGIWVGARAGVFAISPKGSDAAGHADVHWWRVSV